MAKKRRRKAKKHSGAKVCVRTRKGRVACGTLTSKPKRRRRRKSRK